MSPNIIGLWGRDFLIRFLHYMALALDLGAGDIRRAPTSKVCTVQS